MLTDSLLNAVTRLVESMASKSPGVQELWKPQASHVHVEPVFIATGGSVNI